MRCDAMRSYRPRNAQLTTQRLERRFTTQVRNACGKLQNAHKHTRNAVRDAQRRNGVVTTRVVTTRPGLWQRSLHNATHNAGITRGTATAFGNAEQQRHGGNEGLRQRGLRAGCNVGLPQRAMWVAKTRLRNRRGCDAVRCGAMRLDAVRCDAVRCTHHAGFESMSVAPGCLRSVPALSWCCNQSIYDARLWAQKRALLPSFHPTPCQNSPCTTASGGP